MRIPTYLNEENYNILNLDELFTSISICNKLENGDINELYEVYFYGSVLTDNMIGSIYDEANQIKKPCKIVAKCIHTGKDILLYDEAKYGYNPIFCDKINLEAIKKSPSFQIRNSKLKKLK